MLIAFIMAMSKGDFVTESGSEVSATEKEDTSKFMKLIDYRNPSVPRWSCLSYT